MLYMIGLGLQCAHLCSIPICVYMFSLPCYGLYKYIYFVKPTVRASFKSSCILNVMVFLNCILFVFYISLVIVCHVFTLSMFVDL